MSEHAQKPRKEVALKDPTMPLNPEIVRFWEDRFPRRGEAFAQLLTPFYDWKPCVKPLERDAENKARQAIFWSLIPGIQIYRTDSELRTELDDALRHAFRGALFTRVRRPLQDLLSGAFEDSTFWPQIRAWFEESFDRSPVETEALVRIRFSLWASIYYPCLSIVANNLKQARRFKPLHQLWLSGNFPVGFDGDGTLLLHIAS